MQVLLATFIYWNLAQIIGVKFFLENRHFTWLFSFTLFNVIIH